MSETGLQLLLTELDRWGENDAHLALWLRDDDAIAPSPALERLAGVSEHFALPVLLAVIPLLAQPALGRSLTKAPSLLPCQHGWRHHDHAASSGGRKSEFGQERPAQEAIDDLTAGRRRLVDLLGDAVLPVFVPPWNRIAPALCTSLPAMGFAGLSCFRGFAIDGAPGLRLVNTDLDVMDWRGGRVGRPVAALAEDVSQTLEAKRRAGVRHATLGVLLHHRDHDETAWSALQILLATLTAHPAVRASDPRLLFGLTEAA